MTTAPASVDELARLFELSREMLAVISPDGEFRAVNPEWTRALGWEPEQLVGRRVRDLLHPDDVEAGRRAGLRARGQGAAEVAMDVRFRAAAGEYRWLRWHSVADAHGWYCAVRDVTDDLRRMDELAQSAARLAEAQAVARVGSWEWDMERDIVTWTRELREIFGVEPGQAPPSYRDVLALVHEDDRASFDRAVTAAAESGGDFEIRYRTRRADGEILTIQSRGRVIERSDGSRRWMIGAAHEVTGLVRTEQQLAETLALQRATFDALLDGVLVIDRDGRWLTCNRRFLELWHVSEELAATRDYRRVLEYRAQLAADRATFLREAEEILADLGAETTTLVPLRDGRVLERRAVPHWIDDELSGRVLIFRDVTQALRAREDLARSEARLREAQQVSHTGSWEWKPETGTTSWSEELYRIYGFEPFSFEPTLETSFELAHPDDREMLIAAAAERALDLGANALAWRIVRPDGEVRWVEGRAAIEDFVDGRQRLFGTLQDVTEQRAAQAALAESELRFRQIAENVREIFWIADVETMTAIYVSPAYEEIFGRSVEEAIGLDADPFVGVHPEDREQMADQLAKVAPDGHEWDYRIVRPDRSVRWLRARAFPVHDESGRVYRVAGVSEDVTHEKEQAGEVQRQLEELAWVGRTRDALDQDRLVLFAQPIFDVATGEQVQQELLIRMRSPEGDIVPPGLFLPPAEKYGLIGDIDAWVVEQAVALARGGAHVEVNLSANSVCNPAFARRVEELLDGAGDATGRLVFELTETALMRDEEQAGRLARRLAERGCSLALDDFGTGFGGFSYLKRLPLEYLKIDVEFVRDLAHNPASQHVVRAVVNLAHGFGQKTVAEGVEDERALELLREYGVDYAQGYFLGRPAPVAT